MIFISPITLRQAYIINVFKTHSGKTIKKTHFYDWCFLKYFVDGENLSDLIIVLSDLYGLLLKVLSTIDQFGIGVAGSIWGTIILEFIKTL